MKQVRALWLLGGFIVAPTIPLLAIASAESLGGAPGSLLTALGISVVVYLFSAPVIAVIGLPALLLASRVGLDRWWVSVLFGGASGAAVSLMLYSHSPPRQALFQFVAWGASAAWLVWLSWWLGARHEARLAANNSSKPTPLRGAA